MLSVLVVPVVAFGVIAFAMYLYLRLEYMGHLTRVFNDESRPARPQMRRMSWGWLW